MVSCGEDPTHLSTVRHCYQQTVEALLDNNALVNFPEIGRADIQAFQEIYGSSAFVCRRPRCVFSTTGFESASQRDEHESKHQRQYRCAYTSCVSFAKGFANRKQLRKHNETYHIAVAAGPSLAESLAAVVGITQQQPQPQSQRQVMDLEANFQQQQMTQQQSLAAARANAQAKAQIGLQGWPGGIEPMPPQQSSAMGETLNTSPRTPSQYNRIRYDIIQALRAQATPRSGWMSVQERMAIIFDL